MSKIKKPILVILAIIIFILTGCANSSKIINYDELKLPPEKNQENYSYKSELISKGDVELTKNFSASYFRNFAGTEDLCLIHNMNKNEKSFNMFKKGEKGKIYINSGNPDDASNNVTVYNGIVYEIQNSSDSFQTIIVKIEGGYDENIVRRRADIIFKINIMTKVNCLRVPLSAVKNYNGTLIAKVDSKGIEMDEKIKAGLIGDDYAEVISGLVAGQKVITGYNTTQ